MNKRRLITFGRIVNSGVVNLVRNAWLAVAAIAVMVVTLGIILFLVIANATFANSIQTLTDRINISMYLEDSVTTQQREELIGRLEELGEVESVEYISKDQALKDFIEQNKDRPELQMAATTTDNPLPASLRIKPVDPNNIDPIREFIEQPDIQEVQSEPTSYSGERKEAIDNIARTTRVLQIAGTVGVLIFALVSVLIIFNTIRMAVFNRRDELTIMRLLGASTWYIRGPYVVEAILYGVIAALLSLVLCSTLFSGATTVLEATSLGFLDIEFASNYFNRNFWSIFIVQILVGVAIGAASSVVATRRYLKFKPAK